MRNRLGNACDSLDIILFQYIARVQNLGFFVGTVIDDDDDDDEGDDLRDDNNTNNNKVNNDDGNTVGQYN